MIGQPLKVCVGGLPARGNNYVNNQKMPYLMKTIFSIKGVPLIDYRIFGTKVRYFQSIQEFRPIEFEGSKSMQVPAY